VSGVVPDPFRCQGVNANAFEAGTFRRLNMPRIPTISEGLAKSPLSVCRRVAAHRQKASVFYLYIFGARRVNEAEKDMLPG
jgi:hypothetical protein